MYEMAVSRAKRYRLGFVPTMGALHAGHLSLLRRAQAECRDVVVSIFVNPTQFGPGEDFKKYPRNLKRDRELLRSIGAVRIFSPSVETIYPEGFASTIRISGSITQALEAKYRPGHFDGVATVVARLFGLVKPERAYFGLKDYQQYLVIQRMTADLALPVEIVGCPTLREADGLAMSSRNAYLSSEERAQAPQLYQALQGTAQALRRGLSPSRAEALGLELLKKAGVFKIQYFSVADAGNLKAVSRSTRRRVILAAAILGKTRLIDNVQV
jgi:pantoate--beta-alanine ligase